MDHKYQRYSTEKPISITAIFQLDTFLQTLSSPKFSAGLNHLIFEVVAAAIWCLNRVKIGEVVSPSSNKVQLMGNRACKDGSGVTR